MGTFDSADAQIRKEQSGFHQREIHRSMSKKRIFVQNNNKPYQKKPNFQKPVKKPFQAKGHDRVIAALQKAGEIVKVFVNYLEEPVVGKVIGRDRFTITIASPDEEKNTVMMIFKSAVLGIIHKKTQPKVEIPA